MLKLLCQMFQSAIDDEPTAKQVGSNIQTFEHAIICLCVCLRIYLNISVNQIQIPGVLSYYRTRLLHKPRLSL